MSTSAIDFLAPRATHWLGGCLLVLGAVAVGTALHFDRQWARERAQHEAAAGARAGEVEQRRRDAARPIPPSPEQRRLQHIAPQLRQPWLPVLRAIEGTTRPPVHLLALAIDPVSGAVRMDGEAPSFEKALEYAKTLDQEGLLGPADLRSHEQVTDANGHAAVRFMVVTRWSAR